jgi:hypothetical protein
MAGSIPLPTTLCRGGPGGLAGYLGLACYRSMLPGMLPCGAFGNLRCGELAVRGTCGAGNLRCGELAVRGTCGASELKQVACYVGTCAGSFGPRRSSNRVVMLVIAGCGSAEARRKRSRMQEQKTTTKSLPSRRRAEPMLRTPRRRSGSLDHREPPC